MKSRLHLYPHSGPNTRGYIVAERSALKELAKQATNAANGIAGLETVKFYGSDGHEYELMLVCDVAETEWQGMPLPNKKSNPELLEVVQTYNELKPKQPAGF